MAKEIVRKKEDQPNGNGNGLSRKCMRRCRNRKTGIERGQRLRKRAESREQRKRDWSIGACVYRQIERDWMITSLEERLG
jgi:hypothetical protein